MPGQVPSTGTTLAHELSVQGALQRHVRPAPAQSTGDTFGAAAAAAEGRNLGWAALTGHFDDLAKHGGRGGLTCFEGGEAMSRVGTVACERSRCR